MDVSLKRHPIYEHIWISPDGRVFQERPAHDAACGGYMNVTITHGSHYMKLRRCHLVCETYHGPRPDGLEVRHLNGMPSDDRQKNLTWGTHLENGADMVSHGRTKRGDNHHFNKLGELKARELKRRALAGESGTALAREFGMSPQLVCDVKKGRAWKWLET